MSRTIIKYQNRKLYDRDNTTYINLTDLEEAVVNGEDFVVIDHKTKEDITRKVLLTIIAQRLVAQPEKYPLGDLLTHIKLDKGEVLT